MDVNTLTDKKEKIKKYEDFIESKLKVDLENILLARDKVL
jgi:hypothetical protein